MNLENLKTALNFGLPGSVSHQKMAPHRISLDSFTKENTSHYKDSAVAVVLFKTEDGIEIILIQRPVYEGKHSGQVSFPGGKHEKHDLDLYQTAKRECFEEVGLNLNDDFFVGKLSPVYIPISSFYVDVNLFFLPSKPELIPDQREVSELFFVNAAELLNDEKVKMKRMEQINDSSNDLFQKEIPYFDLNEKIIWGATAIILSELKDILKRL